MVLFLFQAKRTLKAQKLQDELASGKLDPTVCYIQKERNTVEKLHCYLNLIFQEREHDSEDEDEDKYADDIDMPGQNFDSKRRITVRNLRIREDTAKVRIPIL